MIPAGELWVKKFQKRKAEKIKALTTRVRKGGGVLLTFYIHQIVKTVIMKNQVNQVNNLKVCVSQKIHSLLDYNFVFSLVRKISNT